MALIPISPTLGLPKLDQALPASSAAGRSTPYKIGDVIRATRDNQIAFELIYLPGAAGVTQGGQVTYNPNTFAVTNGAGTPGPTAISATAMAAVTAGLNGWFRVGRGGSVPPAGLP